MIALVLYGTHKGKFVDVIGYNMRMRKFQVEDEMGWIEPYYLAFRRDHMVSIIENDKYTGLFDRFYIDQKEDKVKAMFKKYTGPFVITFYQKI